MNTHRDGYASTLWLAAMIDGEGTICWADTPTSQPDGRTARISLGMTDRGCVERTARIAGDLAGKEVRVRRHPYKRADGSQGVLWHWALTALPAVAVIAAIYPHLVTADKQRMAMEVLMREHHRYLWARGAGQKESRVRLSSYQKIGWGEGGICDLRSPEEHLREVMG